MKNIKKLLILSNFYLIPGTDLLLRYNNTSYSFKKILKLTKSSAF